MEPSSVRWPRCCAFLESHPKQLCNYAGKESFEGLLYCDVHITNARKLTKEYRVIQTVKQFAEEEAEEEAGIKAEAEAEGEEYSEEERDDDEKCAVCCDDFKDASAGERVHLECNHAFHTECIGKWLTKHDTCPCCRAVSGRGRLPYELYDVLYEWLFVLTRMDATTPKAKFIREYITKLKNEYLDLACPYERADFASIKMIDKAFIFAAVGM